MFRAPNMEPLAHAIEQASMNIAIAVVVVGVCYLIAQLVKWR